MFSRTRSNLTFTDLVLIGTAITFLLKGLHNRHEAADRGSATSRQILRVERTCHGRRGTAEFDPIADSCVTRRDHRCSQSCMDRSRASSVGVVLRCLAPVEHAVVAHDAAAAKPRALWEIDSIFEGLCIC